MGPIWCWWLWLQRWIRGKNVDRRDVYCSFVFERAKCRIPFLLLTRMVTGYVRACRSDAVVRETGQASSPLLVQGCREWVCNIVKRPAAARMLA